MDRREFLTRAGLVATWAGITVTVGATSDSDSPSSSTSNDGSSGDVTGTVTGGGHTHTVALTSDQVGQIADGQEVSVMSSSSGSHNHTVTFN